MDPARRDGAGLAGGILTTRAERFDRRSEALAAAARDHGFAGLVLLGSSSAAAAHRRDEWSDHDFFMLAHPGGEAEVRDVASWLPDPDRLVLVAREGEIGFAAVYDDGHVFEFAAATAEELDGALATEDAGIPVDDGPAAALVAAAQARVLAAPPPDPANDARLVLVKLLIGVGRERRGESLVAGQFVHVFAVTHFARAVRARLPVRASVRDRIDPVRRFERDYPELGASSRAGTPFRAGPRMSSPPGSAGRPSEAAARLLRSNPRRPDAKVSWCLGSLRGVPR